MLENLRQEITELEDLLRYMTQYELLISHKGFKVLYGQLRNMRIQLAEMEYAEQLLTQKQILEN